MKKLNSVCAWCNRSLTKDNEPQGELIPKENQIDFSHGICNPCIAKHIAPYVKQEKVNKEK